MPERRYLVDLVYTPDMGVTNCDSDGTIDEYIGFAAGPEYGRGFEVDARAFEIVDETGEVIGYLFSTLGEDRDGGID